MVDCSLCQVCLLQGQACWRVAVNGAWQQAHEVLAVPRQAAGMSRTRQRPPTLGSTVALQIWASEGLGDLLGCGRTWSGCCVPAAETAGGYREVNKSARRVAVSGIKKNKNPYMFSQKG